MYRKLLSTTIPSNKILCPKKVNSTIGTNSNDINTIMKTICGIILLLTAYCGIWAQKPRARDIGIPFEGTPGKFNAITDVKGVEVGFSTIISGQGKNLRGQGPVRTGVTAILPRGRNNNPVYSNWYTLNGNGEMTGTTWITESGFLEGPVMITNTNSVGVVRDAVLKWFVKRVGIKKISGTHTR